MCSLQNKKVQKITLNTKFYPLYLCWAWKFTASSLIHLSTLFASLTQCLYLSLRLSLCVSERVRALPPTPHPKKRKKLCTFLNSETLPFIQGYFHQPVWVHPYADGADWNDIFAHANTSPTYLICLQTHTAAHRHTGHYTHTHTHSCTFSHLHK